MEMEDQYNMSDLRQLMNGGRTHFPSIPLQPATELFPTQHRGAPPPVPSHHHHHHHPYEQLMMMGRPQPHDHIIPRGLHPHEFLSQDTAGGGASNATTVTPSLSGGGGGGGLMEAETGGDIGGSGRWPRQETLTLLEIRSRLDFKFKEANQKGPLWDEVSRIMSEEHGYQRSGKKCREKFENLYKYYKKTKEGKAGRQDGKHYRFFRQLEALYGETANAVASPSVPEAHFIGNNNNLRYQTTINAQANQDLTTPYHQSNDQKHCESLSLSNSSEIDTSSSEDQDNDVSAAAAMDDDSLEAKTTMRKRRGGRGWKAKIKEFIDAQMRKLMEKQEEWLERLMRTLEQKERERMVREEEWRKQEVERVEREHKFWAKERAWIEARDKALMEALHKLTGGSSSTEAKANYNSPSPDHDHHPHHHHHQTGTDHDQIIHNMTSSAKELLNKKRKENVNSRSTSACYYPNNESCSSLYSSQGGYCAEINDHEQGGNDHGSNSPCGNAANVGNAVHDNCFPFLMSEGENLWENYELKLSNGSQNQ